MRSPPLLLLLAGLVLLSCSRIPDRLPAPETPEGGATATAPAAPPALSQGEELSEALKALLLTPEDLPLESGYYLEKPGDSRPYHNTEVVEAWGGLPGWEYLQATGRVDGYFADYLRGSEISSAPEEFFCNVTVFATPEGARLSLTDYNLVAIDETGESGWSYVENPGLDLGDLYLILTTREKGPDGEGRAWYRIEFSYRNYVGVVAGFGLEDEVGREFMEAAARALLANIEAAAPPGP